MGPAFAIELDEATRTVTINSSGKTAVYSPEQVKRGKRLFNASCSTCHTGGVTKTNPNVGLESIAEIHPSIKSADIFPKMRSLTEDDLEAIAGHILMQPKIVSEKWGGGKIYY